MSPHADKLAASRGPQRRQATAQVRVDAASDLVEFVISTETKDRHNSIIRAAGWDLAAFEQNPVVLWNHDAWSRPPVGRAEKTWVDGETLRSLCRFVPREVDAFAGTLADLYRQGFMRAVSVGFDATEDGVEWSEETDCVVFTKQQLLEYSCVAIGSNPEALSAARSAGIDMKPLIEWAERTLDAARGPGLWVARSDAEVVFQSIGRRIHAPGQEPSMPATQTPPPAAPDTHKRADPPPPAAAEPTLADVMAELKKLGDRVTALEDSDPELEKALDEETKALEAEAAEVAADEEEPC